MGVRGMNLSDRDEVVAMQLDVQGEELLIVSEKGMGKRTRMEEFTAQNRGGKGVKCYKITEKTGNVVGAKAVNSDDEIMIINTDGIVIRMECAGISVLGRITSGVKLINLKEHEEVASIAKVRKASRELEENAEETRKVQIVRSAISTLSFSELEAITHIFEEMDGKEGILVASKIADRVGITRSVIVNALRKFESAGVIESRSSGMKGTYIKVLNDVVFDELEKIKKQNNLK